MPRILKKLKTVAREHTSHGVGLMQSKAYRVLKRHTNAALQKYNLSSVQWAMLGLLSKNPDGMRLKSAAAELGVEAPFLTVLSDELSKEGYTKTVTDSTDSRAKVLLITVTGRNFVRETEPHIRSAMRPLLRDVGFTDLLAYLHVLEKIVENDAELTKHS